MNPFHWKYYTIVGSSKLKLSLEFLNSLHDGKLCWLLLLVEVIVLQINIDETDLFVIKDHFGI